MKKNRTGTILACLALITTTVTYAQPDTIPEPDSIKIQERYTNDREEITKETTLYNQNTDTQAYTNTNTPTTNTVDVDDTPSYYPPLRHVELGVRYIPTFYNLNLYANNGAISTGNTSVAHGYGAMLGINFTRHLGIQAEANYYEASQRFKDQNLERQVDVAYLNIPVLLSMNTNKRRPVNLNLVAGPQFGINVGSTVKTVDYGDTETAQATIAANGTDVGLAYGAGLEFALNKRHNIRLDLGYRGFYGLIDGKVQQSNTNPDAYNISVRGSRKTHAAYAGFTLVF